MRDTTPDLNDVRIFAAAVSLLDDPRAPSSGSSTLFVVDVGDRAVGDHA